MTRFLWRRQAALAEDTTRFLQHQPLSPAMSGAAGVAWAGRRGLVMVASARTVPGAVVSRVPRGALCTPPRRWASLSAIHAGRRREERAQAPGFRHAQRDSSSRNNGPSSSTPEQRPLTFAERRAARKAAPQPAFRIKKGKKDITQDDRPKPKSRRARFYDPADPFGKKSRVYQAKTGQLDDEAWAGGRGDDARAHPPSRRRSAGSDRADAYSYAKRDDSSRTAAERRREGAKEGQDLQGATTQWDALLAYSEGAGQGTENGRRGGSGGRRRARDDEHGSDRRERGSERREPRSVRNDRSAARRGRDDERPPPRRETRDREHREKSVDDQGATRQQQQQQQRRAKRQQPLSIPFTTAASQFLYGKTVVEAALLAARRKLYKLYIYGGAHRENLAQDATIRKMAERQGVPVQILAGDDLRLLDKLSGGRPHNGYVLEASPLPQPPLVALGALAADGEDGSCTGFEVRLAHQSAEDAAINGTEGFCPSSYSYPGGGGGKKDRHRPFVVVLDQILDPGNLGAILRSASFLGATAVGITKQGTASLTPAALKASAGASESLRLYSVPSLPSFLDASRANGWRVYAAVPASSSSSSAKKRQQQQPPHDRLRWTDVNEVEDRDPLARDPCVLVVGSEGEGLSREVRRRADVEVSIPKLAGGGRAAATVDSLNVSVAAALLCSSFLKGVTRAQTAAAEAERQEKELF